jgi:hypothetical protein
VSESRRRDVVRYIQNQEQHHRRISFQEEFLKLLRSYGVEFDKRYIWQSFLRPLKRAGTQPFPPVNLLPSLHS